MKYNVKPYVRYLDLSVEDRKRIDKMIESHSKQKSSTDNTVVKNDSDTKVSISSDNKTSQSNFIDILKECGCEIPEKTLEEVLNVLDSTNTLKNLLMTIVKNSNQQALLDLDQALNVVERKLQHIWEYNGFQKEDDIKFKNFLMWRRTLKSNMFFWKKLYQTNTIIEMQRAWNAYTQDPNDKILLVGDRIDSTMKRFQISTESISTIFNTRRPFTRVFYATDKETAYKIFKQWMTERNLQENPRKTVITELKNDGSEDPRGKEEK
jgi:hypothetical protein